MQKILPIQLKPLESISYPLLQTHLNDPIVFKHLNNYIKNV